MILSEDVLIAYASEDVPLVSEHSDVDAGDVEGKDGIEVLRLGHVAVVRSVMICSGEGGTEGVRESG